MSRRLTCRVRKAKRRSTFHGRRAANVSTNGPRAGVPDFDRDGQLRAGHTVHGFLLAMRSRGATIAEVVAELCGHDREGMLVQAVFLEHLRSLPTLHLRWEQLEHWLRSWEGARWQGSMWRLTGPASFVGHRHLPAIVERIDEHGNVTHETNTKDRRHCPKGQAKGLAERQDVCARTCDDWRKSMRDGGLWASQRVPFKARDAVKPKKQRWKNGRWAYAQHWLPFIPPPVMRRRWQQWAKLRKAETLLPAWPEGEFDAARVPTRSQLLDMGQLVSRADVPY